MNIETMLKCSFSYLLADLKKGRKTAIIFPLMRFPGFRKTGFPGDPRHCIAAPREADLYGA